MSQLGKYGAGSKRRSHRSDNTGSQVKGSAASAILKGAGRSLNAVRQEMADRAKAASRLVDQDRRRKPCAEPECPNVHLKGSAYCPVHDR